MRRNPSHKVYERRWKETSRKLAHDALVARLFIGVYPCALVYADRSREVAGDYARLACLTYSDLVLRFEPDCPAAFRPLIEKDAKRLQSRWGESFQISTSGQTVRLGGARLP